MRLMRLRAIPSVAALLVRAVASVLWASRGVSDERREAPFDGVSRLHVRTRVVDGR